VKPAIGESSADTVRALFARPSLAQDDG